MIVVIQMIITDSVLCVLVNFSITPTIGTFFFDCLISASGGDAWHPKLRAGGGAAGSIWVSIHYTIHYPINQIKR